MAFGVYIHIPFCLQRCIYCDFATFEVGDPRIGTANEYLSIVCREIENRHSFFRQYHSTIDTIYFGGGTPSLLDSNQIGIISNALKRSGFKFADDLEWTIEINPATLSRRKMTDYLRLGINRFSLGVQTFSDSQLKFATRKHTSQQTRETLKFLEGQNFNMDLLFGLPHQSLADLSADLDEFDKYQPPHISPYCLTVPKGNPMEANRPSDIIQEEMFDLIRHQLAMRGYEQYEISNYARVGFKSRHNELYWNDASYWGIGLSSHSYISWIENGVRFWNPSQYSAYFEQMKSVEGLWTPDALPVNQIEKLKLNESVFDFCHTALRTAKGLSEFKFSKKFSLGALEWVQKSLRGLPSDWIGYQDGYWRLTPKGQIMSNQVFSKLVNY